MYILILTLIILVSFWAYRKLQKNYSFFENKGIPCKKPTFFVGNMGSVVFRKKHFSDLTKEIYNLDVNAKYVGAYNFTTPAIVIRDLELVKSVTIKNFDHFMDHQTFVDINKEPLFKNIFLMKGEKWREARNLLSPAFTSAKMRTMFELMVPCVNNLIQFLKNQSNTYRSSINSKDIFTKFTNDVIATCAFGLSVDSLKNPNNDFYLHGLEATNTENMTKKFFLNSTFPLLVRLFNIKFLSDKIANYFRSVIETTVKAREENGIRRPDILQLLIDARNKIDDSHAFDTDEIISQLFIFFFAGFDSTSTQMSIIAHELAINPDVQKKLQEEIDQVLKETNGMPNYESINAMPYLDAIFNESMRLHPSSPMLDRICTKEFELPEALPGMKPLLVKPGSLIWIPVLGISTDPRIYENPKKFDPNRFLGKSVGASEITNGGFGIGPRICIGKRFAILETKILFFYLLSEFNLRPTEKTCNPLKYDKTVIKITAEGGFSIAIEPRERIMKS